MNRIAAVVAGLSLAFVGTSATIADTINVPADQPTIAAAINASSNDDVINIAAGTYNEHSLSWSGKSLTIQGELAADGSSLTIIDAKQAGPVFELTGNNRENDTAASLKNLIITGGSTSDLGGGISCVQARLLDMNNCRVTGNTALAGGGLYCWSTLFRITDCTFDGNTATGDTGNGGGMSLLVFGGEKNNYLQNCTVTNNSAQAGGGIWMLLNENLLLDSNLICDNQSGGGMKIVYGTRAIARLTKNTVCNNSPNQIDGNYQDEGGNVVQEHCPKWACCLGGTCITATASDCSIAGGSYGGDNVACADAGCATVVPGDVDVDGDVDTNDLSSLRSMLALCASDTDMDGDTDIEDLLNVVAGWGTTCP